MKLIKGGLLYNGDLNVKASIKNILIKDGKIAKISSDEISVPEGTTIIDATGKWIAPGFVDTHTHYDAEVLASPGLKESARHGVTSVIIGSCSVTAIYNSPLDTSDSFTRVEAIPREIMLPLLKEKKTWSTSKGWQNHIESLPLGINIASYIGHSDLRSKVMGLKRAVNENEVASKAERKEMEGLLNTALDEGFIGMSTIDSPWLKMDGDRYWSNKTPSYYGSWSERSNLIKTLRKRNAIFQGAPNLVTRINAVVYMLSSASFWIFRKKLKTAMIAMMDLKSDRRLYKGMAFGVKMFNEVLGANFRMQSPPVPFTVYYDGVDSVMFEEFPSGEAMRHLARNLHERDEIISDPKFREEFKADMNKQFGPKVWDRDLKMTTILECPDESLIGKNFMDIASERQGSPSDVFLDLIVKFDKKIKWTTTIANDRPENFYHLYNYKYNQMSFSDAGAHLVNMAFYDITIQMITNVYDSIERGNPIMSMEKCIWRLTAEQADWFGVDCGHVEEGKIADLVIIDPEALKNVKKDTVAKGIIEEFDNFERLVNRNENVVYKVIVGGEVIFENEDFVTGYGKNKKYGRLLKSTVVV